MTASPGSTTGSRPSPGSTPGRDAAGDAARAPDSSTAPRRRTTLGQFCTEFEKVLRPLLEPLGKATDELASVPEDVSARQVLPALRDLSDQFSVLVDKVAEQQAYVLIFGPLKSGKSTLMNAICAKYVSEVTALPAYPCLVQVAHAKEPRYAVTRYNGASETFADQHGLRETVESEHRRLVDAIRRCEDEDTEFEPQRHAPEAIRRIDVRLPAGELSQTSAVLVDTPGLYSRMKFGYDRMTRDFRNAAACAIFVVKTDNLFLDQVFDEFNELLELFSRIFLIVNLDAAKQDLRPDGTLTPSLEHENPGAVVQAFENLSMGAPLKRARAEGRLRIYPVDLLGAASRRIRGGDAAADEDGVAGEPRGQADFDLLLTDLMDYLNSNEYLKAFLGDSLRRTDSLLDELSHLLHHDGLTQLGSEVRALADEQTRLGERRDAAGRLVDVDWGQALEVQGKSLIEEMHGQVESAERGARNALHGALDRWFENDDSLQSVIEQDVEPTLSRCRDDVLRAMREALGQRSAKPNGGLALTPDARHELETIEVDPGEVARAAVQGLDLEALLAVPDACLGTERIPVRRGILDWLLLRSRSAVRKRLFGAREKPDEPIPARTKAKRLGAAARVAMRGLLDEKLDGLAERARQQLPADAVEGYGSALTQRLVASFDEVQSATRDRLAAVEARLGDLGGAQQRIEALGERATQARGAFPRLEERFRPASAQRGGTNATSGSS